MRAGGAAKNFWKLFRKILTVLKIVAQWRKRVIPYLYTFTRTIAYAYTLRNANSYLNTCIPTLVHALPILIHWLGFRLPILIHALPILIHLVGFRVHILIPLAELYPILIQWEKTQIWPTTKLLSAANQNRAPENLRLSSVNQNWASQCRKKTQTLSARVEDPSRLSAPAEPSRLAIAYFNKWRVLHPPPPPDQLTLLLFTIEPKMIAVKALCIKVFFCSRQHSPVFCLKPPLSFFYFSKFP